MSSRATWVQFWHLGSASDTSAELAPMYWCNTRTCVKLLQQEEPRPLALSARTSTNCAPSTLRAMRICSALWNAPSISAKQKSSSLQGEGSCGQSLCPLVLATSA